MRARLGHQPALDGLRGLAVLLVLVNHVDELTGTGPLARAAYLGVDLFFVLSGFLITTLIFDRRNSDRGLWPFYRRRALRLLPAVLFLLAGNLAAVVILEPHHLEATVRGTAMTASYLMNWFLAAREPVPLALGHMWSLAIEEQFYIVWPAVLVVLLRFGATRRRIAIGAGLGVAAVVVWRIVYGAGGEEQFAAVYYRTDTRADALLIGCIIGILRPSLARIRADIVSTVATLALVLFLLACFAITEHALYLGGFTLVAAMCAVMIVAAVDGRWSLVPFLKAKPLVGLGKVSYSVYLWHVPVIIGVAKWAPPSIALRLVIGVAGTTLLSLLSYRYVEQPFLRWKTRLDERDGHRESPAAAPAAATA